MPEAYDFSADSTPIIIPVAYRFTTQYGDVISVSFIEATKLIDIIDPYPVLSNAISVEVDRLVEAGEERFDSRVGATIAAIIQDFIEQTDRMSILVFNCFSEDGKQLKRHNKFQRWFDQYGQDINFEKRDREILEPQGDRYVPAFLSILFSPQHPRMQRIETELERLSASIASGNK